MAREVRLWEWLRDGLRPVAQLHMVRVENLVSEGDPDVEGCYAGRYFELELKGCSRPKLGGRLQDFEVRRSQRLYHRKRSRCGGNNWLYVRVGVDRDVRRYLVPGRLVYEEDWDWMTEGRLAELSVLDPRHTALDLLARVAGYSPAS